MNTQTTIDKVHVKWVHRRGKHRGAIVLMPVLANRLVYLTHGAPKGGWAIRDFIGGKRYSTKEQLDEKLVTALGAYSASIIDVPSNNAQGIF